MKVYRLEIVWKELGYRRYYFSGEELTYQMWAIVRTTFNLRNVLRYGLVLTDHTELPPF